MHERNRQTELLRQYRATHFLHRAAKKTEQWPYLKYGRARLGCNGAADKSKAVGNNSMRFAQCQRSDVDHSRTATTKQPGSRAPYSQQNPGPLLSAQLPLIGLQPVVRPAEVGGPTKSRPEPSGRNRPEPSRHRP